MERSPKVVLLALRKGKRMQVGRFQWEERMSRWVICSVVLVIVVE